MDKSKESPPLRGRALPMEGGHLILPFDLDLPLDFHYSEETGILELSCPNVAVGNLEKAGILRLRISPEAAHSLLRALREIEKSLDAKIATKPKPPIQ